MGIVRRPDPAPCPNCAVGEWDICANGRYTERGIKQADGFMSERWRIEPDYAVRVDKDLGHLGVLLEPATVVAKAWDHIGVIGRRTLWDPHVVLVVGAGPIGLLAALIGVEQGPPDPTPGTAHRSRCFARIFPARSAIVLRSFAAASRARRRSPRRVSSRLTTHSVPW